MMVDPATSVNVVWAVHATIFAGLARLELQMESVRTEPMIARTSPETMVHRLPKISDKDPAREKLTEEAMDQPPTIQEMFSVSPRSVPTGTRIPVMRTKPQEIGHTYENDKD